MKWTHLQRINTPTFLKWTNGMRTNLWLPYVIYRLK